MVKRVARKALTSDDLEVVDAVLVCNPGVDAQVQVIRVLAKNVRFPVEQVEDLRNAARATIIEYGSRSLSLGELGEQLVHDALLPISSVQELAIIVCQVFAQLHASALRRVPLADLLASAGAPPAGPASASRVPHEEAPP